MTIKDQTIKLLNKKYGVTLNDATDEELITFMEYYKMYGIAELYKQLRVYEHNS